MPILTLSMIIKNEENFLEGCLNSVKNIVDEIVIVDTGSTDNSINIAKKYNAKIYNFNWIDDFSAARNFALSKSDGEIILYLDADERLDEKSINELKISIKENKGNFAYYCNVISKAGDSNSTNIMKYLRVFSNHPKIYFEGKAHEQIEKSLIENNYKLINSNINIIHLGYDVSPQEIKNKAKRNIELLLLDYKKNPTTYGAFQIGQTFVVMEEFEKSEPYFLKVIKNGNIENHHLAHTYRYLSAIELNVKNNLDAALDYVKIGLGLSNEQPLLNVIASNIYLRKADFDNAEFYSRKCIEYNEKHSNTTEANFEIILNKNDLINHGLNIAMLSCNIKLFQDFYNLVNHNENNDNRNNLLKLYNQLFNDEEIEENLIKNCNNFVPLDFITSFLFLLDRIKNKVIKISILENLYKKFFKNTKVLNLLGTIYLESGEYEKAYKIFEESISLNPNEQLVLFNLISLSTELNKTSELLRYIGLAEKMFVDNEVILNKLKNIKSKLTN